MGVLIRNTETGYEVTLDINVAKEIAAQMKVKVLVQAPTQGCDTLSAEGFLKMWEPPAKEKN